jgi:hypothetical protein
MELHHSQAERFHVSITSHLTSCLKRLQPMLVEKEFT